MRIKKITKQTLSLVFVIVLLMSLSTCKKYDEGGFVARTCKNLFGGNKVGNSKTWRLTRYEVNGIDSTYLINWTNNIPDFYSKFIIFTWVSTEVSPKLTAKTFLNSYDGSIGTTYKKLNLSQHTIEWSHEDSTQCKSIDNILYCSRGMMIPETSKKVCSWNIQKLTKHELILEATLTNKYKLILSY